MSGARAGEPAARVTVRRATEADRAAICAIDVHSRQWGYRGLMPDDALDRLRREERAPRWRAALAPGSGQRLWLAEGEGRGLGFAEWGPARDADLPAGSAELCSLYLEQDARGSGVAARLVAEALREMRAAGYARAVLWVLEGNGRARRFYGRQGWVPDGARKTIVRCGVELQSVRYGRAVDPG